MWIIRSSSTIFSVVVVVLFVAFLQTTNGFLSQSTTAEKYPRTRFHDFESWSCSRISWMMPMRRCNSLHPLFYYFCDPADDNSSSKKKKKDESSSSPSTGHDFEMDMEELERARAVLEALIANSESILSSSLSSSSSALSTTTSSSSSNDRALQQSQHLLTSAGRRMRELEMQLLASLKDSDAAIEELIHLWSTERDETAANDLIRMQSHCSEGLVEEEAKLRSMCQKFIGWAEPYARLTTLLYYLGRTAEAVAMAEQAIALKPWHFEVLQMSILLARHEQSDPDTVARAQQLACHAMPLLAENPHGRRAWVSRALVLAKKQLAEAEEMTLRTQRYTSPLTEDDIWQ